jgi:hypothetical protein
VDAIDMVIAAGVLAAAVALLWRSLRRSAGGGCAGCHGGCATRAPEKLVALGGAPLKGPPRSSSPASRRA